jgi:DNA-binding XRE family transcriptional regulator
MTQERLASASGVNLWTIRGYEQGRREPNWRVAIDLAKALGVAVEAFADCSSQEGQGEERSTAHGKKRQPPDAGAEAKPKRPRGRPRREA